MTIRKMILQNINTSQGILKGSFDMMLAGGGVGDYNKGCAAQWGSDWGQRYGGVDNEQACCKLPEGLRSSCLFRFKHLGENPPLAGTPQRVRCPVGIIGQIGIAAQGRCTGGCLQGHHRQDGSAGSGQVPASAQRVRQRRPARYRQLDVWWQ